MKAVIYARYSSHNQREESIEGQLRECHEFAARSDITVIDEYIDRGLSGKTDNRPNFQRMIKDSEKGKFDVVITYTLDRFARNRYDSAVYKAKLKKNGVKVFYAKQEISDGPEGIILESVLEGMAEYYSENLARNIRRGMRENALNCIATGGTHMPLGYRIGDDKRYEIDPIGAKTVKEIFQMYADGQSVSQIIEYCNAQGYRTKLGKNFNKNSLHRMLRNKKYIGTYKFGEIEIPDGMPAIVEKETFKKVQEMLLRNSKKRARTKAHSEYLLTSKLFCGHCGAPMVGESGTSKSGKTYYYYKCSNQKRHRNCDKIPEKKEWIERLVVQYAVDTVLTDSNIELIATKVMEIIEKDNRNSSVLSELQRMLKDVERKTKNIMSAIEQGVLTSTTKQRLVELEQEREEIEVRIVKEEMEKPLLTKERVMYWLHSFKKGKVSDVDYQRKIVDTLINSIFIYDEKDGDRKIVMTFNTSTDNKVTLKCSDITGNASLHNPNPNTMFVTKRCFGFIFYVKTNGII